MSEKPGNQVPDPDKKADQDDETPEGPEQIWPLAEESPEEVPPEETPSGAESGWSRKVRKIDDAIEELRHLNGDSPEEVLDFAEGDVGAEGEGEEIQAIDQEMGRLEHEIDAGESPEIPAAIEVVPDVRDEVAGGAGAEEGREAGVWPDNAAPEEEIEDVLELDEDEEFEVPVSSADESVDQIVAGVVDLPRRSADLAVSRSSEVGGGVRQQAEGELGQLWGNVFFSPERTSPKAIIVTAARRRDGATQIATALALIGAEASREHRIALIDFNLRSPEVAKVLGIEAEPGLTDVLHGRCTLEAALHEVTLKNGNQLHVLPSGPTDDKPLGLLKSRQVQSVIGKIQDHYDYIIIDVAAANAYPDAQVIGALVDGALLVLRAGETPREAVAEAKKRLDLAGVRCLGLVLNQRGDPIPGFVYRMT